MPRLTPVRKRVLDEAMKNVFFNATVAIMTEHGVDGLTMDRVAATAGVGKGSLYAYFRGKEELLQFVHARAMAPILEMLAETAAAPLPALEKLSTQLNELLVHVARNVHVFRLLFLDETARELIRPSERGTHETGTQLLAKTFRQGIDEGVFRAADPLVLAHLFLNVCTSLFDEHPSLATDENVERLKQFIMDVFLNGVAVEKSEKGPLGDLPPSENI